MSERLRLPNRRTHEAISFDHGGFRYLAGVGRFADGRLAEIFISAAKSGTVIQAWARDSAILASIALQHGVDPETIRHALSRDEGDTPASPLGALLDILVDKDGAAP